MKFKIFFSFFSFFSLFSCNHRCSEAMEDARNQKRDTAICYLWRKTDEYRGTSTDSGYVNYKSNGDFEYGLSLKELKYGNTLVFYTINGNITDVGCQDNGSAVINSSKYTIKGDSLFVYEKGGARPRYIKISKSIP